MKGGRRFKKNLHFCSSVRGRVRDIRRTHPSRPAATLACHEPGLSLGWCAHARARFAIFMKRDSFSSSRRGLVGRRACRSTFITHASPSFLALYFQESLLRPKFRSLDPVSDGRNEVSMTNRSIQNASPVSPYEELQHQGSSQQPQGLSNDVSHSYISIPVVYNIMKSQHLNGFNIWSHF